MPCDAAEPDAELLAAARRRVHPTELNARVTYGHVAAALRTGAGAVHVGVCADLSCSLGFCAEVSATAAMLTAGDTHIVEIVAVNRNGDVIPPCGRCRELLSQLGGDPLVAVSALSCVRLSKLLPLDWKR